MDIAYLLQPLSSPAGPCGDDLIFSSEFDEIQEARRFDDPTISQGEWVTDIKEADWPAVVRICEHVLANKAKDLRLVAWLTEARCKIDGLAGLADGYTLLGQLSESQWDHLHPLPDDGDIEQRVGVLDWLVNQTARLIREVQVTNSSKGKFSLTDLESARVSAKNLERDPGMAEEMARNAALTVERFEAAAKDTPRQQFDDKLHAAERLMIAMVSAQTILNARMGEYAPSFGPSLDALDDVKRFLQRRAGPSAATSPQLSGKAAMPAATQACADINEHASGSAAFGGPVRSREQAIQQLQEIAIFFRRTEPHSPVAYLAEKAAKWGSMPLHEWLRTVVKDDGALLRVEELLGVAQNNE